MQVSTKTRINQKIKTVAMIGSAVVLLAVMGAIVESAKKSASVNVPIIITTGDPVLNMDRTIPSGAKDVLLMQFDISTTTEAITMSKITINAWDTSNNKAYSGFSNLTLATCTENSSGNITWQGEISGQSKSFKKGKVVFKKSYIISRDKNSQDLISMCLRGNVPASADSKTIQFGIKTKPDMQIWPNGFAKSKKTIKNKAIKINFNGPKISIVKESEMPVISFIAPKAGDKFAQKTLLNIEWAITNYSSASTVSIFLMKQTNLASEPDEIVKVIAEESENYGKLSWMIPSSVAIGDKYYIQIDCDSGFVLPYSCKNDKSAFFSIAP